MRASAIFSTIATCLFLLKHNFFFLTVTYDSLTPFCTKEQSIANAKDRLCLFMTASGLHHSVVVVEPLSRVGSLPEVKLDLFTGHQRLICLHRSRAPLLYERTHVAEPIGMLRGWGMSRVDLWLRPGKLIFHRATLGVLAHFPNNLAEIAIRQWSFKLAHWSAILYALVFGQLFLLRFDLCWLLLLLLLVLQSD